MTWKQLIKLVKKEYGLKEIIWIDNKYYIWDGDCSYWNGTIRLNRRSLNGSKNFGRKVRTLFHELGHIHCYQNGIWSAYHHAIPTNDLSKYQKSVIRRTGLKAERWVDRWAAKEMKKYYPNIKYRFVYLNKENVKKYFYEKYLNVFYG